MIGDVSAPPGRREAHVAGEVKRGKDRDISFFLSLSELPCKYQELICQSAEVLMQHTGCLALPQLSGGGSVC